MRSDATPSHVVVMSLPRFGGAFSCGLSQHAIPWSNFTYDPRLGGYQTDITESQLQGAPAFSRDRDWDWTDRNRERELHDYYRAPYYWGQ